MTLLNYCKDLKEATFFGGSFNPWHSGHTACIKAFPKDKKLIVVPDFNPEKEVTDRSKDFYQEVVKASQKPESEVYPGFLLEKKKNPTYFWVKELSGLKVNLLLGADSFLNLKSWIEGEKLVKLLHGIYVVPRLAEESSLKKEADFLLALNPDLKIIFLPHHPYEDLSSTKIRLNNK
ncbi:MAG: hypothetical protein ACOYL6_11280 [Bacteriovoracaceae bacterium]